MPVMCNVGFFTSKINAGNSYNSDLYSRFKYRHLTRNFENVKVVDKNWV